MQPTCWLCLNNNHDMARYLQTFVVQNIASVNVDSMTDMLHAHLQETHGEAEGTSKDEIQQDIQGSHLLCPSLQMAHNLCSLLELLDTLHRMLITEGEVGQRTGDSHNMSNYLKVISKIAQGR